jgi:UDP-N-acetylmuramoyl-tripeptide--D-alanyl-D-alanine ligase
VTWSIKEIADFVGSSLSNPELERKISGFSIDSRTLSENELFVAIRGEKTDGHFFLAEAFERGASAAIIEEFPSDRNRSQINLIQVEDSKQALQQLAHAYRKDLDIPIIGITGSSGKTTTKELLHSILAKHLKAYRSPGNYNTEIGAALALLDMPASTQVGIFELGLQKPGDIETLCELVEPNFGLITNIGPAHLEHFENSQDLGNEKWKLAKAIPSDGILFVNMDDKVLSKMAQSEVKSPILGYGVKQDETLTKISQLDETNLKGLRMTISSQAGEFKIASKLLGLGNVYAILATVSVAQHLEIPKNSIESAIAEFQPVPQRMELKDSRKYGYLIDDCYNANPDSVKNAIRSLSLYETKLRKSLILGDMLELGDQAEELHRALANDIAESDIELVLTLGEISETLHRALAMNKNILTRPARSHEELMQNIEAQIDGKENLILVKGSRGMELEKIVEFLV